MKRLPVVLLRTLIRGYQLFLSPLWPASCRYSPTCSTYAREALLRHGAVRGARLALVRLLRCHPWGGAGYDPVPEADAERRAPRISRSQA